ncbi:unnamed protein product [Pelagomonas calceolata]|uniref:Uncharacterized protein n=1 Tax=Pelagomonas calceolata TaxID=35677 RepID=A0A8J2SMQ8_9STRA|nr:unnamed protein product [Pelagomonas calceolata]|mmetsp:Transcript_10131/g.31512  ORF Transcript_10131/g.31512 Transcript_10131/m.31512 type:complete len:227 (+) Transcript_10131:222-902(+)
MSGRDVLPAVVDENHAALVYHTRILPYIFEGPYFGCGYSTPNKIAERPGHVAVIAVVVLQRNIEELRQVGVAAVGCWSGRIDGDLRAEDPRGSHQLVDDGWARRRDGAVNIQRQCGGVRLQEGFGLAHRSGFGRRAGSGRRGGGASWLLTAAHQLMSRRRRRLRLSILAARNCSQSGAQFGKLAQSRCVLFASHKRAARLGGSVIAYAKAKRAVGLHSGVTSRLNV